GKRGAHTAQMLSELQAKIAEREKKLSDARRQSEKLTRELGRAEGARDATNVTVEQIVPVPHVRSFARELSLAITEAEAEHTIGSLKNRLAQIRERIKAFIEGLSGSAPVTNEEIKQQVTSLES